MEIMQVNGPARQKNIGNKKKQRRSLIGMRKGVGRERGEGVGGEGGGGGGGKLLRF